ncbi:PucR family transcriptional regulator [Virgibacillus oceani]
MEQLKITIDSILKRELFRDAVLVAGTEGRNREIKWTHILEMDAFDSFINGGELILTTGSNIAFDSADGISKVKKLIESDVAGICVELGTHINKIDAAIIEMANHHAFPLITFTETVKFVDITQDLHTIIINSHHEQLHHLHVLSNEFNELSLEPNGILKILKKLHGYFNKTVLLITDDKKMHYYPLINKEHTEYIHSLIDQFKEIEPYKDQLWENEYYTFFPIKGLGQSWGNLCLQEEAGALDEFSFSILDRAALAIAQILLRNRTIEERKQNQEEDMVQKLLLGEGHESSARLKVLPPPAKNLYYRLIVIENHSMAASISEEDWEEIKLQQAVILRSLFKKHGFFPAISVTRNKIAVIASFYKSNNPNKNVDSYTLITEAIREVHEKHIFQGNDCYISASSLQKDYTKLTSCYKEADEVLQLQKMNILHVIFYENIGVYRLLIRLPQEDLQGFVTLYLKPLLDYDQKTNNNLLLTLSTYLETMGSKKETSERLFIVRQTLYHRLEKIEELMDKDILEPTKRQGIELAIRAYALLHNIHHK